MSKVIDALGNEVVLNENSFRLTQTETIIHDTKFESKTTTFMKDAFKRFCKNKSSIVGAFIIGLLVLLSIIVPIVSPHDVKTVDPDVRLLRPRLFTTGTFWTGNETITGITYDTKNEVPVGFNKNGVVEIISSTPDLITSTTEFGEGGTYVVLSENKSNDYYLYNYALFPVTKDGGYKLNITLDDLDNLGNVYQNTYHPGEYRIVLTYDNNQEKGAYDDQKVIVLQDWTLDYKEYEFDLSKAVENAGLSEINGARLRVEVHPKVTIEDQTYTTFVAVKEALLSCNATEGEKVTSGTAGEQISVADLLSAISLTDANNVIRMTTNIKTGKFDNPYWKSNGIRSIANLEITVVDFVYNSYYAVFGDEEKKIGQSTIQSYIDAGYMEYDFSAGTSSFKILDEDHCPIVSVMEQIESTSAGSKVIYLRCMVCQYKQKGYTHMPKYVFGTDASGFDIFTKCFSNLLRSLALAIVTSAICFCFGLVWGAISGYFGGTVDLMMERFCEILGGVPWVVVMTLVLLLLDETPVIVRLGVAMCLTGWMGTAGTTRTQFYRFKGREYILASRTLGATDMRLIFKHILPNSMGTIITSSVLKIPACIFTESSLAYLGLLSGTNSFGTILSNNQQYLSTYPMLIILPAIIISLLMISFNLFGNGLRDAFNPSLKGSE